VSTDEFTLSMGEIVGQNVSRLRERARLTQNDLVMRIFHRTGETWTRAQLSTIENGKRESVSLAELLVLACAFDITLPDLFAAGDAEDVPEKQRFNQPWRAARWPSPPRRRLRRGLRCRSRPTGRLPRGLACRQMSSYKPR
jgi:transcriptional regulator with XRE-family HTH domain